VVPVGEAADAAEVSRGRGQSDRHGIYRRVALGRVPGVVRFGRTIRMDGSITLLVSVVMVIRMVVREARGPPEGRPDATRRTSGVTSIPAATDVLS
jgi:hypothetical protein